MPAYLVEARQRVLDLGTMELDAGSAEKDRGTGRRGVILRGVNGDGEVCVLTTDGW